MTPLPSRLSRPAVVAGILFTPLTAFANAPDWEAFVENCQSTDIIACQKKVRVELDIDYDTRGETLIAVIDQVDNDGIPLTLDAPIEVSFSADRPLSTHTTTHFHTVSFRPLEEVIKVPNAVVGIEACVDSPFATFPSCGWYEAGGVQINDSQGFCCNKGLDNLGNNEWWRGEMLLGEQSTVFNNFSTAHCLRPGELRYQGREIQPPAATHRVQMQVTADGLSEAFSLGIDTPGYISENDNTSPSINLGARRQEAAFGLDDLADRILYYPHAPVDHSFVVDFQHYLMLIDREEVSRDGSQCDKVGTSFTTFRQQALFCANSLAGDCLKNQLFDKNADDEARLAQDPPQETLYLTRGIPTFAEARVDTAAGQFEYPFDPTDRLHITLEIDAVDVLTGDADGDGVGFADDQCPGTVPGEVVDANGCSINQRVPCEGPLDGGSWKNHVHYVLKTIRVARQFFREGLIDRRTLRKTIVSAARSSCGRIQHPRY